MSLQALQAIRDLNDQAHVGIILSGNDKIYKQMLTGQKGREFDQIRTRIIVRKRVENNYTVEEMQHIFPGVPESCLAFLIQMANLESLRTDEGQKRNSQPCKTDYSIRHKPEHKCSQIV